MSCIRDRNIDWMRKRVFRGAMEMQTFIGSATIITGDAGASVLTEIGAVGISAIKMSATGDLIQDFKPFPTDYDVAHPSYWRCYFTSDTTAVTKTWTPTMKYKKIGTGTAIAAATVALDTAIAQDLSPGANKLAVTPWGKINANKFSATDLPKFLSISFKASGTLATNGLWFIGYEFEYTPKKCYSDVGGKAIEAERRVS